MPNEELNFEKMNGLLPVVIQDYQSNEVLMVGFMDEKAWKLTLKKKKVHYYSRKKKRLWMKGEESGHFQHVKEIYLDNDNDTLLIKVKQIGGACEDGYRSCFDKLLKNKNFIPVGQKIFNPKEVYKNYSDTIIFVIPSGSLYSTTIMLLNLTGFQLELRGERSFKPKIRNHSDIKLVVARAQEIPHLIETGQVDIGLVGADMVEEYDADITDIVDLKYNESGIGAVGWVLAVPKEKKATYKSLKDFEGKRVSTEIPHITKQYFIKHKVHVSVEQSVGTTESKAPFFADAIVDLCETGKSINQNGLVPLYTLQKSTVHLYAHNHSMAYGWKRRKIEKIVEELKTAAKELPKNPKQIIKLPKK